MVGKIKKSSPYNWWNQIQPIRCIKINGAVKPSPEQQDRLKRLFFTWYRSQRFVKSSSMIGSIFNFKKETSLPMLPPNHISPPNPQYAFNLPVQILWIFLPGAIKCSGYGMPRRIWSWQYRYVNMFFILSLPRFSPFVYAYLGLLIICRKGKKSKRSTK